MKKKLFALMMFGVSFGTAEAQSWRLVINKTDGQTIELNTADIRDIQFIGEDQTPPILPDQNVDQIIIKEVYNGGCPMDEGTEFFQMDKCIILYNNCPQQAVVNNLCFGMATPYNAESPSIGTIYGEDGSLVYENEGFIPAQNGIWYYPYSLVIEPYSQVVINVQGAIDNTATYSQSVNYANKDYFCMYDPESGYNNTKYYPTPADVIPTSHYLKTVKYGQGNAWALSVTSPALFIFQPQGVSPVDYANQADNLWYAPGVAQTSVYACIRVPNEWVIDAVEVFNAVKKEDSKKRLTADLDVGYVYLTNKLGHSLYRNVDKELTESLPENKGKLVYGYTLGMDGSTDPAGIDAEASMRNGAHIVFQDNDNSSEDFHERQKCSLRAGN
ncbi:MAG: DUF4876 domain-containing protein [Prevotella sp.]|nr:DUF4876 domain-containing protein [Prevotella sp.]